MAHNPIAGSGTPEAIAYALLMGIARAEGKLDVAWEIPVVNAEKDWILDTYAECLRAVQYPGKRA